MFGHQVGVQLAGQQRPCQRERRLGFGLVPRPVQGDLAQVPDSWRELHAQRIEQPEVDQRHPVCVRRVLSDRDVGGVAQNFVEDVVRLAFGGDDDLRAVGRVLVGDMRVC